MTFKKRNYYTTEAQAKDLIPVFPGSVCVVRGARCPWFYKNRTKASVQHRLKTKLRSAASRLSPLLFV